MSKGPWDEPEDYIAQPRMEPGRTLFAGPKVKDTHDLEEAERRHAEEEATGHAPWYRRIFRRSRS
ncbi:MAG TPA: hypothetical protein VK646_04030 [Actinomycetota bacterium]|nr:hypothetical protein [Actinomycetota bacterium]